MTQKHGPTLTLVLGGTSSGKSAFAEKIVEDTGTSAIYIATAQAFDAEMKQKIADHRARRGALWSTIEAPLQVAPEILKADAKKILFLDCLTLWLSNLMLQDIEPEQEFEKLLAALANRAGDSIVVSNEVGHGIVPDNALARRFRNYQGRLNQMVAAQADTVVFVTAGLPQVLKGNL